MKKIMSIIATFLFVIAIHYAKAQTLPFFSSSGTGSIGVINGLPALSKSTLLINSNMPVVNIVTSGANTSGNPSTPILPGAGTNAPLLPGNDINRKGNNSAAVNVPGASGNVSNATSIPVITPGQQCYP